MIVATYDIWRTRSTKTCRPACWLAGQWPSPSATAPWPREDSRHGLMHRNRDIFVPLLVASKPNRGSLRQLEHNLLRRKQITVCNVNTAVIVNRWCIVRSSAQPNDGGSTLRMISPMARSSRSTPSPHAFHMLSVPTAAPTMY